MSFETFPCFLEGLLPEGYNLEALLRAAKIDRHDLFSQLVATGADLVGAVTVSLIEAGFLPADLKSAFRAIVGERVARLLATTLPRP